MPIRRSSLTMCLSFVFFTLLFISIGPSAVAAVDAGSEVFRAGASNWGGNVQTTSGQSLWWQNCNGTPPDDAQFVLLLAKGDTVTFEFTGESVQIHGVVLPVTTCSEEDQLPSASVNGVPSPPPSPGSGCPPNWYPAKCNTVLANYSSLNASRKSTVFISPNDAQVAILNAVVSGKALISSSSPFSVTISSTHHAPSPMPPSSPSPFSPQPPPPHSSSSPFLPPFSISRGSSSRSSTPYPTPPTPSSKSSGSASTSSSSSSGGLPGFVGSTATPLNASSTASESVSPTSPLRHIPSLRQTDVARIVIPVIAVPLVLFTVACIVWTRHRRKHTRDFRAANESFVSKDVRSPGWQQLPEPVQQPSAIVSDEVDLDHIGADLDPEAKANFEVESPSQSSTLKRRLLSIRNSVSGSMLSANGVITLLNRFIVQSAPATAVAFGETTTKGIKRYSKSF